MSAACWWSDGHDDGVDTRHTDFLVLLQRNTVLQCVYATGAGIEHRHGFS